MKSWSNVDKLSEPIDWNKAEQSLAALEWKTFEGYTENPEYVKQKEQGQILDEFPELSPEYFARVGEKQISPSDFSTYADPEVQKRFVDALLSRSSLRNK